MDIKAWLQGEDVARAVRTFLFTFLTLFIPGLLGWLHAITEWAADQGSTPFPDAHGLAYVGVSAIVAACVSLVNLLWNFVESATGKSFLRSLPAKDEPPEASSTVT
jgi:hypothetical protein